MLFFSNYLPIIEFHSTGPQEIWTNFSLDKYKQIPGVNEVKPLLPIRKKVFKLAIIFLVIAEEVMCDQKLPSFRPISNQNTCHGQESNLRPFDSLVGQIFSGKHTLY